MKVIIGGSGFIGTRLARRLAAAGDSFLIIDKQPSAEFPQCYRHADVRNIAQLEEQIPEGAEIINLAAEHRDDVRPRTLYQDVNVGGAINICGVARRRNIRKIVFTSSVACYGFALGETAEDGKLEPFNDYGRTKLAAEKVFRDWQSEAPAIRSLTLIRPTVVFGEQNRGNVYNLLAQIASGRFVMVGAGKNVKSLAYVENVAAFIEFALSRFGAGLHLYNYVDKPDMDMVTMVSRVRTWLGKPARTKIRLPLWLGLLGGYGFDVLSIVSGRRFPISAIRVRKFAANTQFATSVGSTGFRPPVDLEEALYQTVHHEFVEPTRGGSLFFTE